eukprot:TRINITY_DN55179_c0_g1_i1.p1 TRINITY_DN55179_c0_g1~~TRINITY_DN55179_c0_g1_i1.p1  ORF type:complete len:479 (-),score=57.77 TRINITY_DN55179_c0_g1_i1:217-1653(-)
MSVAMGRAVESTLLMVVIWMVGPPIIAFGMRVGEDVMSSDDGVDASTRVSVVAHLATESKRDVPAGTAFEPNASSTMVAISEAFAKGYKIDANGFPTKPSACARLVNCLIKLVGKMDAQLPRSPTQSDRVDVFKSVFDVGPNMASKFPAVGPITAASAALLVHTIQFLWQLEGDTHQSRDTFADMHKRLMDHVQLELVNDHVDMAQLQMFEIGKSIHRYVKVGEVPDSTAYAHVVQIEMLETMVRQQLVQVWGPRCWVDVKYKKISKNKIGSSCDEFGNNGAAVVGIPASIMHLSIILDLISANPERRSEYIDLLVEDARVYAELARKLSNQHKKYRNDTCIKSTPSFYSSGVLMSSGYCNAADAWDSCRERQTFTIARGKLGDGRTCSKFFTTSGNMHQEVKETWYSLGCQGVFGQDCGCDNTYDGKEFKERVNKCHQTYIDNVNEKMSRLYDHDIEQLDNLVRKIHEQYDRMMYPT